MNEGIYMDQNKWLISVALSRRHLTEGQKAVLENEYREILSKKFSSDAGKKANDVRWHSEDASVSETVSSNGNDEQGSSTYSENISNY
jgi:hypothetical protein